PDVRSPDRRTRAPRCGYGASSGDAAAGPDRREGVVGSGPRPAVRTRGGDTVSRTRPAAWGHYRGGTRLPGCALRLSRTRPGPVDQPSSPSPISCASKGWSHPYGIAVRVAGFEGIP